MSEQPKTVRQRVNHTPMITSWPHDPDGNPMAIVCGSARDLVPTVPMGNVDIGPVTIMRPVPNGSDEQLINDVRNVQRMVEYAVGVEHRLVNWALNPSEKITSPIPPDQAFAAPPQGYDPSSMPAHPADAENATSADGAVKS